MNRNRPSGEQLAQDRFGTSSRAASFYANQMLDHLNAHMRQFIAKQEMVFIATANGEGACDCSFRAGTPGFVHVLDENSLAYPEYRGNGVLASVGNILENPHIGMIFLDCYQTTMGLHVNGTARVLTPTETEHLQYLPARMIEASRLTGGRRPLVWVIVKVDEAYVHCSKHVPRMKRLDKVISWGTDNETLKGGDFFRVKAKQPHGRKSSG